jgi:hypothetical protein
MVRPTVSIRRIAVPGKNDRRLQLLRSGGSRVEGAQFEPEEYPIASREGGVADGAVMVLDVPAMELKQQLIVLDEPFVLGATVTALAPQQTLVPAATCLNITDADQGLWTHRVYRA